MEIIVICVAGWIACAILACVIQVKLWDELELLGLIVSVLFAPLTLLMLLPYCEFPVVYKRNK